MSRLAREQSRAREPYAFARARLLRENRRALSSCLEPGHRDVDVLLTVSSLGSVEATNVLGVPDHSAAAACLRSILRNWSFPIAPSKTFVRIAPGRSTEGATVPGYGLLELKSLVRCEERSEIQQLEVARIYDFPYWASGEHLAWLVANSTERYTARFDKVGDVLGSYRAEQQRSWLTHVLAAELLRGAGDEANAQRVLSDRATQCPALLDAQRVLSEVAPDCPDLAARTLRAWGLPDDAASIPPQVSPKQFPWRPGCDPSRQCTELAELIF